MKIKQVQKKIKKTMELYIYPNQKDPTQENLNSLREIIVKSLRDDAVTWEKLERTITIEKDKTLFLFEHKEKQYKNEPFYLWYSNNAVAVKFENNKDEGSKSMIIGMLTYYLRYNLRENIGRIEIK
ncbi:hypothetical protein LPB85_12850 [Chryseobacterium sp. LC2016-27]|uniref:hypothetical protein n=1 Tax=Chryseobacterium sp. LC2016-27 TaxID=2897326 RepID=UPI001E32A490|nr:hypothetical protein [Chryseobacterium sp. LC2016-27]MCD0456326.1 hypothetical protein [Chryseobacterium sp. LC2016-27]